MVTISDQHSLTSEASLRDSEVEHPFKVTLTGIPNDVINSCFQTGFGIKIRQYLKTGSKKSPITDAIIEERCAQIRGRTLSWVDFCTITGASVSAPEPITVDTEVARIDKLSPEERKELLAKLLSK